MKKNAIVKSKIHTMKTSESIKQEVKNKYASIAESNVHAEKRGCCGSTCGCGETEYTVISDSYEKLAGYDPKADLGLGCGLPTEFAHISKGDTVVDLGSGAGNDCFVAAALTGEQGKVIGIDMTEKMIALAQSNAQRRGVNNAQFILGDIETIPLGEAIADVVVSNCVLNLVPDKKKAFGEIYRILKPGGHFSISDIVTRGNLPGNIKEDAEAYAGCVGGALDIAEYLGYINQAGFRKVKIQKEKRIDLPEEILNRFLTQEEQNKYFVMGNGIFSVTVYAEKP
jgi:ubiquinone/menaquinone biosynthesis C-methylase UbiE